MSTNNIRDIVATLPLVCQGTFRPLIEETYEHGCRYYSIGNALDDLYVYQRTGKDPNAVNSIKVPTLQVSSEWKNSGKAGAYEKIESETVAFRKSILGTMIRAKEAESKYYWDCYLAPNKISSLVGLKIELLKTQLVSQYGSEEAVPGPVEDDLTDIQNLGEEAARKSLELANARSLERQEKSKAKRTKKAQADVEMTGTSGGVNDKTLEKHVASILKRQEQSRRDKKASGVKGNILFHHLSLSELTSPPRETDKKERWEEEDKPKRLHFKRKIIEETSEILEAAPKRFKVGRIGDYPDAFFEARLESRVLFIRLKSQLNVIRSLRFMNFGVHKAHNVILPKNIEYFLAVNLKYIFPQKNSPVLGLSALGSAVSRLRTWFHFRDATTTGERLDPYLATVIDREPVDTDFTAHYESAILAGRNMMISELSKVIPSRNVRLEPEPMFSELGCTVGQLKEFMLLNHYMAFITDKNLGIAVVEKQWYLDETLRHLNLPSYLPIPGINWDSVKWDYEELIQSGEGTLSDIEYRFLDQPGHWGKVPSFHTIPKIHKNPWKVRPITPMHSFFTTRLAMWLHLKLHPLQQYFPWICTSSRDFVRDLLTETEGKRRTWKMFTGDVQSMYTNIRTDHLLQALRGVMKKHGFRPKFIRWVLRAVEFLNGNVFFQFHQQLFKQSYGIAMGLACGPTLANLFMAAWEERVGVHRKNNFTFYRRYIDDVFALSEGQDNTALVSVPGLILDWESKDNIPFLDCEVHLHGSEVCVRPYAKPLSHYQYIPWNSGHPRHVLKSLVKTELLRFSSLSARPEYFVERKKRLHTHLRARGWPESALKAWTRQVKWRHPTSRRWNDRSTKSDGQPLFMGSKYNPIWNQVRTEPVWEEMLREIVRGPVQPPPFPRLQLSLQRTTNLWDVVRRSNRDIVRPPDTNGLTVYQNDQMQWQSEDPLVLR